MLRRLSWCVPLFVAVTVAVTAVVPPAAVAAVTPGHVAAAVAPEGSAEPRDRADDGSGDAGVAHVEATATLADGTAASDELVAQLQTLLSHQATLTSRLTRATLAGDPRFVEAADNALVRSITDLRRALTPVVGARAARRASSQWEHRTQALFQYATGIRDDAPQVRRVARRQLDRGIATQATMLSELSDGRVAVDAATAALDRYVDHQIAQAETFADDDHRRSYELQQAAFSDTFPVAAMTARGGVDVPRRTPTDRLRIALTMLLGAHVELAIDTMRTGASGADDFEAAAAALDANTAELTEAIDALFGPRRARDFNEVWADHIDLFMDYTIAVVEDDAAVKREVRAEVDRVARRFGATLEAATNGRVDGAALRRVILEQEQQLADQIETFADDDLDAAHGISYQAYVHIRHAADELAADFAAAAFEDMPIGGAQTGGGGAAVR